MENKSNLTKIRDFLKTTKGFVFVTVIAYFFIAILVAIIIWSGYRISKTLELFQETNIYPKNELFLFGSILGVSIFLVIIINLNVWTFWSYTSFYNPELKDKVLLKNWFKNQNKINKENQEDEVKNN